MALLATGHHTKNMSCRLVNMNWKKLAATSIQVLCLAFGAVVVGLR